ncbi:MAG: hypothetical protein JF604_19005 [Bradyrhizobium sp.]|nr:hypothetical protein [Bradyrhizobium sp.]
MLLSAAALMAASLSTNVLFVLVALTLAMSGGLAGIGPFQSMLSGFARGPAAASGLALVNTIGTLGGFFGPVIVGALKARTGNYAAAMAVLGAAQLASGMIVLGALNAFAGWRRAPSP